MKTFRTLVCAFAFLSACYIANAKPESTRIDEQSIPSAWNAEVDTLFLYQQPLEQKWWLRFNDPILTKMVEGALQNNFDLKQAAYRVAQAKAAMRVAQGGYYPTINLNAGYNYNQNVTVPGATSQVGSVGL